MKIKLLLLMFIVVAMTMYFGMPALSLTLNFGTYGLFTLLFIALGFCFWERDNKYDDLELSKTGWASIILGATMGIIGLVISLSSWSAVGKNALTYRDLIGRVDTTDFSSNIQPIAADQMIIVDEENARKIGEKELGSVPGLGSRVHVGTFHRQGINGQLYWIAPLEHSGFFKWWRFGNAGTPGYLKVSATNKEDYQLVLKHNDGSDIHIVYQDEAYFSQDLDRKIYFGGYASQGFTDKTFEIDDNGQEWWVVTLYDTKVGFLGADATGVLVINPETGRMTEYSIEDAPEWIDRIQPLDFVKTQADDWGEYVHGWRNTWSGNDMLKASEEYSIVMAKNHRTYFYIGLQSKGTSESTVGFMLVDTRNKKAMWFKQSGATESAAGKSALDKVKQMNYNRSEGVCYNVDGHATYEFLLKGDAGLTKLIALVNVHDHSIVGIGEDRQQAMYSYQAAMHSQGNAISYGGNQQVREIVASRVKRIGSSIENGASTYFMILFGKDGTGFFGRSSLSADIPLTQVGDSVIVIYTETDKGMIVLSGFRNLTLNIQKDSVQTKKELELFQLRDNRRAEREKEASMK